MLQRALGALRPPSDARPRIVRPFGVRAAGGAGLSSVRLRRLYRGVQLSPTRGTHTVPKARSRFTCFADRSRTALSGGSARSVDTLCPDAKVRQLATCTPGASDQAHTQQHMGTARLRSSLA